VVSGEHMGNMGQGGVVCGASLGFLPWVQRVDCVVIHFVLLQSARYVVLDQNIT